LSLRDLISKEDIDKINDYRELYAPIRPDKVTGDFKNAYDMLKPWEDAKSLFLSKLFQDKLILEKEIHYSTSEDMQVQKLRRNLNANDKALKCLTRLKQKVWELERQAATKSGEWKSEYFVDTLTLQSLINNHATVSKKLTLQSSSETIDIFPGSKIMKIFQKIARDYNIPYYDELYKVQSCAKEKANLNGTLCLSIHPLDYMTMSDNSNDWTTCLSWRGRGGCFRAGTTEMLNSNCVIVAYLKDNQKHLKIDNDGSVFWNSKRWRSLFVVTPDLISGIKEYPFVSNELNDMVYDWLRELAAKNADEHYDVCKTYDKFDDIVYKDSNIIFTTDLMYNDYEAVSKFGRKIYFNNQTQNQKTVDIKPIKYSGKTQCMWCGTTNADYIHPLNVARSFNSRYLCCEYCEFPIIYCDSCGNEIYLSDEDNGIQDGYRYYNGEIWCEDCWTTKVCLDINNEPIGAEECTFIIFKNKSGSSVVGQTYIRRSDYGEFLRKMHVDEHHSHVFYTTEITQEAWDYYNFGNFIFGVDFVEELEGIVI